MASLNVCWPFQGYKEAQLKSHEIFTGDQTRFLMKKVLINVEDRELRVAILEDDQLVELYIESLDERSILNNIYKGKVEDVLPGLKAAFVNIGLERNAFLHFDDVRPDLLWGKYRELNPEMADEVPTAREALAASVEETEEEETADARRKRKRGRRGGKKRRPDQEETYTPGLPVGVTEDDLEDEDEEEHEHVAAAPSGPVSRPPYAPPPAAPAPVAAHAYDEEEEGEEEEAEAEVSAGAEHHAPAYAAAEAGAESAAGEDEAERRRLARAEKQRLRRERWEQKKLERQQRRQQERSERPPHQQQQQAHHTPAVDNYVPPSTPTAYGTRGATPVTIDTFATLLPGAQRRSQKQIQADKARYGDNFGNILVKTQQRVDHRDAQADFFGPAAPAQAEDHSIWDEQQPDLGPIPVGGKPMGDGFSRPSRYRTDRFGDRRQGGQQQQQSNRKFRDHGSRDHGSRDTAGGNNKRRGGKKRRSSMRKRDNRSFFAFSADDILDNEPLTTDNVENMTAEAEAPKKTTRKRKTAEEGAEEAKPKTTRKTAARKTTTRKKTAEEPTSEVEAPAVDTAAVEETTAPAKATRARKSPATRTRKAAAKAEPAEATGEQTDLLAAAPAAAAPAAEAAPAPAPPKAEPVEAPAPVAEAPVPAATEAPAIPAPAPVESAASAPAAAAPAPDVSAEQAAKPAAAEHPSAAAPSGEQPSGEQQPRERRVRETRAQRFARIRREKAAARAQARAAASGAEASAAGEAQPAAGEAQPAAEAPTVIEATAIPMAPGDHHRQRHQQHHPAQGHGHQQRKDHRPRMRRPQFQEVFKKGDEIMVQVVKEEIGLKGARISSYVSLPGRYLVLLPYPNEEGGISRKVEDIKERKRLKTLLKDISSDETAFIIRTAGIYQEEKEIRNDVEFLSHEWGTIADRFKKAEPATLVYDDHDIIYRLARDVFDDSITEIQIDSFTEYEKLKNILGKLIPNLVDKVKHYSGNENIFHKFNVTKQIQKAARRKVWLKSGGYLIIDEAEALTAIDVNTGKSVGKDDQEKLILRTNLESARAVARELKLRDIGGLIVIDFIDMKDPRNREQVLHELKLQLRKDRSKTSVSAISEFGLVEMTRKRVRRSLRKTLFMDCPYCQGAGVVLNEQQIWHHIKHEIVRQLEMTKPAAPNLNITVNPRIRAYIDQNYKDVLRRLEQKYDTEIRISMSDIFHIENYQIEKAETGVISGSATMPTK